MKQLDLLIGITTWRSIYNEMFKKNIVLHIYYDNKYRKRNSVERNRNGRS